MLHLLARRSLLLFALLLLPACGGDSAPEATPTPPARPSPTVSPPVAAPTSTVDAAPVEDIVLPGDTLSEIAQRFGVTVEQIATANGIDNPDLIGVGQRLTIPRP
jgi:LysM repeat protein